MMKKFINVVGANVVGANVVGANVVGANVVVHTLFFDGCSKGNPGKAGAGAVLFKNQEEIWSKAHFVGMKETNNSAEYMGLIIGLEEAVKQRLSPLLVKGDSLLVIKQMQGVYKVNAPHLIPLHQRASALVKQLGSSVEFQHVYRALNKRADALSNEALMGYI
jgi:ribonuclease HI